MPQSTHTLLALIRGFPFEPLSRTPGPSRFIRIKELHACRFKGSPPLLHHSLHRRFDLEKNVDRHARVAAQTAPYHSIAAVRFGEETSIGTSPSGL